jgi:sporulation protein YlmC with PRC-barrel domain
MQGHPDEYANEDALNAQPPMPGEPTPAEGGPERFGEPGAQPYLNQSPEGTAGRMAAQPPLGEASAEAETAPRTPEARSALNSETYSYHNPDTVRTPLDQPVPRGRTQADMPSEAEYIQNTEYPYEPARNDPRAGLDRPDSQYTPNLEATAAADQQMHAYTYERGHRQERGPEATAWVRLTSLLGRTLLDLENGRRLGRLDNLVLTRDHRFVAGYVVQDPSVTLPPVYPARGATIGEDAIVLPAASLQNVAPESFQGMPLARRLLGMPLVTVGGKAVGKVADVRFDPETMAVFLQVDEVGNLLQRLLGRATTIPVTSIQTFGQDVLIVTDAAARQYLSDNRA